MRSNVVRVCYGEGAPAARIENLIFTTMYIFLTILIVIAAILLTLLVLVQNSKGGGLATSFAGGNQVMGAPKTADFLEKASWTLIAIIVVLSIAAVGFSKGQQHQDANDSQIKEQVQEAADMMQTAAPAADFNAEGAAEEPAAE